MVGQQAAEHGAAGERVEQRRGGTAARRGMRSVPQGIGERQVGDAVAELGTVTGQHREAALASQRGQLGNQPCLADPRVTADQRDDGLT